MLGYAPAGLGYLGATLPITLSIDSPVQVVGKQPTYRIQNARPGAAVQWSSYQNGVDTKEFLATYSDTIGANGSLEVTGGNWRDADIGSWLKEAAVQNEDGTWSRAVVGFQVVSAAQAQPQTPVINTGSSFFQTPLTYLGDLAVTPITVGLAVGAVWLAKQLRLIK
jgi:hypothetical protein